MSRHSMANHAILVLAITSVFTFSTRAEFQPIAFQSDGYNHDVVVEQTAPPPVVPVTTASMDTGVQNTGFTWFEQGYVANWLSAGLPKANSEFNSERSADHVYRMPSSYLTNNAFLIDAQHPTATLSLASPSNYTALSILTSSGVDRNVLGYRLRYQGGRTQTGSFTSPNWYGPLDPAWAGNGRVDTTSFVLSDLNSYNPKLYSVDISLTDMFSPVIGLDLFFTNGIGHSVVFALSGAPIGAGPYEPIQLQSYDYDMVVEATALKPGFLQTNTTATMDSGTANVQFTWYEQGYDPLSPQSGLPSPGSVVISQTDPAHRFVMPASYSTANAVLLDSGSAKSVLKLLKPQAYSAVSFLTASSHNPVTNRCIFTHSDGTSETNSFVSHDWMSAAPGVLSVGGRISVSTRLTDSETNAGPWLYSEDVALTNTTSPVTAITLSTANCLPAAHSVVFAVSGVSAGSTPPPIPLLTITRQPNGTLTLRSTQPGTVESCTNLAAGQQSWKTMGTISSNIDLISAANQKATFYRVVAH